MYAAGAMPSSQGSPSMMLPACWGPTSPSLCTHVAAALSTPKHPPSTPSSDPLQSLLTCRAPNPACHLLQRRRLLGRQLALATQAAAAVAPLAQVHAVDLLTRLGQALVLCHKGLQCFQVGGEALAGGGGQRPVPARDGLQLLHTPGAEAAVRMCAAHAVCECAHIQAGMLLLGVWQALPLRHEGLQGLQEERCGWREQGSNTEKGVGGVGGIWLGLDSTCTLNKLLCILNM